jgi:hypothetical protein
MRELEFGMWRDFEMRCTVDGLSAKLILGQPTTNRFFNGLEDPAGIRQVPINICIGFEKCKFAH